MRNWEDTYLILEKFYNTFHHTNVKNDEIFEGVNLGNWVALQRTNYRKNKLSIKKINLLLSLDFSFDVRNDLWNTYYELAKEYKKTFGDLNIPKRYIVSINDNNYHLGRWIENQKNAYYGKCNDRHITKEHIDLLNDLGLFNNSLNSSKSTSFNECAIAYYVTKCFPNTIKYKEDNVELDIYIPELNVAIEYDGQAWHKKEKDLKKNEYCKQHNITLIRVRENGCDLLNDYSIDYYINPNNFSELETFISCFLGNIDVNISRDMEKIYSFMNISLSQSWKDKYALCVDYFNINNNLNFTSTYITDTGVKLGSWLHEQRKSYKKNKLSNEKITLLNNLNVIWSFS